MNKLLRRLILAVILLISSFSFAQAPKCSDLFGPTVETLLEKAGQLEFDLTQSLTLRHRSTLETQDEIQRLEQVQILIEEIFAHEGSERNLTALANRLEQLSRKSEFSEVVPLGTATRFTKVIEAKSARKDYEGIQYYLKEKYNKFLDEVSRVHSLAELSPSWSLERIDVFEVTREPSYSVRLNQGYRVLFVYGPATGVKVLRISMKVTHHSH